MLKSRGTTLCSSNREKRLGQRTSEMAGIRPYFDEDFIGNEIHLVPAHCSRRPEETPRAITASKEQRDHVNVLGTREMSHPPLNEELERRTIRSRQRTLSSEQGRHHRVE